LNVGSRFICPDSHQGKPQVMVPSLIQILE